MIDKCFTFTGHLDYLLLQGVVVKYAFVSFKVLRVSKQSNIAITS